MSDSNTKPPSFGALSFAMELGFLIAIPLVLFALLGRLLDRRFDTSPWLLLSGIVISIAITSVIIYHKAANLIDKS